MDKINRLILGFASFKFLFHFIIILFAGYGIFRDELYYLACRDHLSLGYVDQPPLSIYLLKLFTWVFGDSVAAIRTFSALAGAVAVYFLGRSVREMGGSAFAISVCCIAFIISPINLAYTTIFSMNVFDLMFWSISFFLLIRIINTGNERIWITLGVVLGLALLNKISTLFLGTGIFIALLVSSERKWFKTPWPYLAAGIAFLIFSPYLIWNLMNDWPHLEFIERATENKYSGLSAWTFITGQFLINHPINFLVYILAFGYLLLDKRWSSYRPLAIIFLVTFLILTFNGRSKSEYLAGAIMILYAGGGVVLETLTSRIKWLRIVIVVLLGSGIWLAPMAAPILSQKQFIHFSEFLGFGKSNDEGHEESELPQFFADMHGWEQKAREISAVYSALSDEEKRKTIIFTDNYGRAGCIDYFRDNYELPPSYSGHNHYSFWPPEPDMEIEIVLLMQSEIRDAGRLFESVEEVGSIQCSYCMPYENDLKIFICRGLNTKITDLWPELRHYN
jgi:hypothetical protein